MIYIATHKFFEDPKLNNYFPLQVGAEGKKTLGYLKDNSGYNISTKNANFCELTGIYWIWKNVSDDYKGIAHYRRYFGKSNFTNKTTKIYRYDELVNFLNEVDIVLPYIEYFKENAKDELISYCCTLEIFEKMERIIEKKYPEYMDSFDAYFRNNQSTLFNMMFCRKEIFDAYCEWLFDILFELEKQVDLTKLNEYQQRLYGFLSERLLNVWVIHNQFKVKNLPIIQTEMNMKEKFLLIARRVKHKYCWKLNTLR